MMQDKFHLFSAKNIRWLFVLAIFITVHPWLSSMVRRYDIFLYYATFLLIFLFLFSAFNDKRKSKTFLYSYVFCGFFLGHLSSFLSNLILEAVFHSYYIEIFLRNMKRDFVNTLLGIIIYPFFLGGWIHGFATSVGLSGTCQPEMSQRFNN